MAKKVIIVISLFFILVGIISFLLFFSDNSIEFIVRAFETIFGKSLFGLLYPFLVSAVFSVMLYFIEKNNYFRLLSILSIILSVIIIINFFKEAT